MIFLNSCVFLVNEGVTRGVCWTWLYLSLVRMSPSFLLSGIGQMPCECPPSEWIQFSLGCFCWQWCAATRNFVPSFCVWASTFSTDLSSPLPWGMPYYFTYPFGSATVFGLDLVLGIGTYFLVDFVWELPSVPFRHFWDYVLKSLEKHL